MWAILKIQLENLRPGSNRDERLPGLEEGLLGQVLGELRLAYDAHQQRVDRPVKALHELAEGLFRAALRLDGERLVALRPAPAPPTLVPATDRQA